MPRVQRARETYSVAAWLTAALVVLGGILSLPGPTHWLASAEPGSAVDALGSSIALLGGIDMLSLWGAALWYVSIRPDLTDFGRVWRLAALVATNFVGAFFYYFLAVVWRPVPKAGLLGPNSGFQRTEPRYDPSVLKQRRSGSATEPKVR